MLFHFLISLLPLPPSPQIPTWSFRSVKHLLFPFTLSTLLDNQLIPLYPRGCPLWALHPLPSVWVCYRVLGWKQFQPRILKLVLVWCLLASKHSDAFLVHVFGTWPFLFFLNALVSSFYAGILSSLFIYALCWARCGYFPESHSIEFWEVFYYSLTISSATFSSFFS